VHPQSPRQDTRFLVYNMRYNGSLVSGRLALRVCVLPGQANEFTVEIAIPSKLGHYQLESGLASMQVTSFTVQSTAPLRISVQVTHHPREGKHPPWKATWEEVR
jgi:riboflavin synthase alpha subunit